MFGWIRRQTRFEVEDAVQETWLNFYKGTVHKFAIRDGNHLEPIIAFLKRCALTVLAQRGRNVPPVPPGSLDRIAELLPDPNDALEQASLRADLERHLADFFEQDRFTEEERLLFRLKFELRLKPREIMAGYPQSVFEKSLLPRGSFSFAKSGYQRWLSTFQMPSKVELTERLL